MNRALQTIRSLAASPALTVAVVLSIGLGLGLNTTLLALVRGVLLRPLGVSDSDRLVSIYLNDVRRPAFGPFPYPMYRLLNENPGAMSAVLGFVEFQEPVTIDGSAEFVTGEFITPNYFETLGVRPIHGRVINSADDHSADVRGVIVVSERFWRRRLGAATDCVGKSLLINSQALTLIGVVRDDFRGMNLPSIAPTDAWVLLSMAPDMSPRFEQRDFLSRFDRFTLRLRARLPVGVNEDAAQQQVNGLIERLRAEHPALRAKTALVRRTDREMLFPGADRAARSVAGVLLALSVLVLLVVCANVTHLFLARLIHRLPEVATRRLLGAGRLRAAAVFLREAACLVAIGAVLAIATAKAFSTLLARGAATYGRSYGLSFEPLFDWRVYATTFLLAIGAGLLCIIAPASLATRASVMRLVVSDRGTSTAGRWATRLRIMLVAGQVSVAVAVLLIAALFLQGARRAVTRDIGLESDAVIVGFDARRSDTYKDGRRLASMQMSMLTRVASLPFVTRATLIDFLPIGTRRDSALIAPNAEAKDLRARDAYLQRVGPAYFDIVSTPILAGRAINDTDISGQPMVVVVSETAARRIWNHPFPIGEKIQALIGSDWRTLTVVGVAGDTDVRFIGERHWPLFYVSFAQHPSHEFHILAETAESGSALASLLADEARKTDPLVPIVRISTVRAWIAMWSYPYTLTAILTGAFAFVALTVSAVGIFGLAHYSTSTRTREFGLRQALGASPGAIRGLVMKQHVLVLSLSVVVGMIVGALAMNTVSRVFFRMVAFDPAAMYAVIAMVAALSAAATYISARQATAVAPSEALRRP